MIRLLVAFMVLCGAARAQDDAFAALRQPGAVALMRHARAPGTGDPANFRLGNCSTQRNLDEAGREQARQIGQRIQAAGLQVQVFSSAWCRTQETAALLGLGSVETLSALNSFFGNRGSGPGQTAALRSFIDGWTGKPLVLVTHQVNITALTGVFPADGETVILGRNLAVLARVRSR